MENNEKAKIIATKLKLDKSIYTCPYCGEVIEDSASEYYYCRSCEKGGLFMNANLISQEQFILNTLNK